MNLQSLFIFLTVLATANARRFADSGLHAPSDLNPRHFRAQKSAVNDFHRQKRDNTANNRRFKKFGGMPPRIRRFQRRAINQPKRQR